MAAFALSLVCGTVHAQYEVSPSAEYGKRLKSYESVRAMGESPFGEQINLYTGMVTFQQADITLEGMGPTISLVRTTASAVSDTQIVNPPAMGNWTLSIPRIETIISNTYGWAMGNTSDPDRFLRCTRFDAPLGTYFGSGQGWHGFDLIAESGERQQILKRGSLNTNKPVMNGAGGAPISFPAVTNGNWQIGCLSSITNGSGEGFFAVSPNGTKYWFNYLTTDQANTIYEDTGYGTIKYRRSLATMYVTRIEDRFGNYLLYNYGGDDKLDTITSSDGRQVSLTWRTDYRVVESITAQSSNAPPRTWQYEYIDFATNPVLVQTYRSAVLRRVVLPDATSWTFDFAPGTGSSANTSTGMGRQMASCIRCIVTNISP